MSKSIVIVGGGFAGAYFAQYLERHLPRDWQLILFSRENFLTFTPMLAEVVGSSISPLHVVRPLRQSLRRTLCRTTPVVRFDFNARYVEYQLPEGDTARQPYEHLVLACGMEVNTNIIPGAAAHAFSLKTLGDAFTLRTRVIRQLENAEVETDPERRRHLLSFAIIGGGFSGVEVAGEIYDLLADSCKFYPSLRRADMRVVLLHGLKHILPELPESLGEYARKRMEARGITFRLETQAHAVTEAGVKLADGSLVAAATVVCTIGNTVNPLMAASGLTLVRGRLPTEPDMRVPGVSNVWALGDCAVVPNAKDGKPSPTLAQFALRQARQLAANLRRALADKSTRPFSFRMLGSFAAIGHHKAVGQVLGLKVSGFFAWLMWRAIYLSKMPSLARKIQIAFDWAWDLVFPRDIVELSMRETPRMPRAHYEPGEVVFRKGDPAEKFYVIEKGKAAVYLEGWTEPVAILNAGDHFGERELLRPGNRAMTVRADGPLDVMTVGREAFQDLLSHLTMMRTNLDNQLVRFEGNVKLRELIRNHPRLNQLRVKDVLLEPARTLPSTMTFAVAIAQFERDGDAAFVVVDEQGRLKGTCTADDFHNALARLMPLTTPLADIVLPPPFVIAESKSLAEAMQLFLQQPIKHLVVVAETDEARPVGILTPFDVLLHYTGIGVPDQPSDASVGKTEVPVG